MSEQKVTLPLKSLIGVGFGEAYVSRDGKRVWEEPGPYEGMDRCTNCWGHPEKMDGCQVCGEVGFTKPEGWKPRKLWTARRAENRAKKDPDHDWRITYYGPLSGATYQRQGDGEWVLIESNRGFA